jgi:hypothetical protein
MKRKFKRIQIFLVISISFSFPVFSTYFHYNDLAEANFLSTNLYYQNLDQENLLAAYQSELKVFGSSSFFNGFLLATHLFSQSSHFFCHVLSLDQKTLILRC